ncbi:MAG: bifunctional precorrin-2 dehydrogenase/sirohydrochlorin ferrochelatase [Megasphaera sp.]|jgi:precorrin-2 dehydrogenase/sirohydrochlorin ferrochelatase|nr:bifunctional precorrin-2 dehydrogenase/sirohydrochlorin ferrochelatase [Megasphaera sp.]MCI1823195.1 bifunctional precorrin-2 dehydrogenase/sirohydrochlorin ferrochelatase [Megasphaera sp.]
MYPINIRLDNVPCAVLGGGSIALQKIQSLLAASADVTIISPKVTKDIEQLITESDLHWRRKKYEIGDEKGFTLLICATDDIVANQLAAEEAQRQHILVNVCDTPALCTFTLPAVVKQGDLTITISTNGTSPALARWMRIILTEEYGPVYGHWLTRLSLLRKEVQQTFLSSRDRQNFWQHALTDEVMELVRQEKLEEAEEQIRHAISRFRSQS